MTHFFLSLSASQVFFGSIVFACVLGMIIHWATHFFGTIHRANLLSRIDEFEWNEDPYAVLSYAVDGMRDDIHVEHAKEVLQSRAIIGAPQMSITNSTCLFCKSVEHCPFSFDPYNMDGDCLMTK